MKEIRLFACDGMQSEGRMSTILMLDNGTMI